MSSDCAYSFVFAFAGKEGFTKVSGVSTAIDPIVEARYMEVSVGD